jgi:large subunit ribosomal protein L18
MENCKLKRVRRLRRKGRIRRTLRGTADRPRLSVFRSLLNLYAQIIDDDRGCTLVQASTLDKALREALKGLKNTGNKAAAEVVGKELARKALEAGIQKVVFDRNGFKFHGRVKAMAEAARAAGLKF